MTKTEQVVERFDKSRHDRSTFDCGRDELNALGVACIVVDAKDDESRAFYERIGFFRVAPDGHRLLLPMSEVRERLSR